MSAFVSDTFFRYDTDTLRHTETDRHTVPQTETAADSMETHTPSHFFDTETHTCMHTHTPTQTSTHSWTHTYSHTLTDTQRLTFRNLGGYKRSETLVK